MTATDLDALQRLYEEADRLLVGWSCPRQTVCCQFDRTGREPYLWPAEWELLARALARQGLGRVPSPPRPLQCALLLDGGCRAHAARPFGCRTFFCRDAEGPTRRPPRAELQEIARQVASLPGSVAAGRAWPRPLSRLLAPRGGKRPS